MFWVRKWEEKGREKKIREHEIRSIEAERHQSKENAQHARETPHSLFSLSLDIEKASKRTCTEKRMVNGGRLGR